MKTAEESFSPIEHRFKIRRFNDHYVVVLLCYSKLRDGSYDIEVSDVEHIMITNDCEAKTNQIEQKLSWEY